MNEYKVIYRNDNLGWQEMCPIVIEAVQISRNVNTAQCYLQTKVRNITNEIVSQFALKASIFKDGDREDVAIECLDADILAGEEYIPKAFPIKTKEVDSLLIAVARANKTEKFKDARAIKEPEELTLSDKAFVERKIELQELKIDSIYSRKHELHDGWWQCGCGSVNIGRHFCHQCGAPLSQLDALENNDELECRAKNRILENAKNAIGSIDEVRLTEAKKAVESLGDHNEAASLAKTFEDEINKIQESKRARKKKAANIGIAAAIAGALVIAGVALNSFVLEPARIASEQAAQKAQAAAGPFYAFSGYKLGDDAGTDKKIKASGGTSVTIYGDASINGVAGWSIITKDRGTNKIDRISWVGDANVTVNETNRSKIIQAFEEVYGPGEPMMIKVGNDKFAEATTFKATSGIQYLVAPIEIGNLSISEISYPES